MANYLEDRIVKQEDTEFRKFRKLDWAVYFIEKYGQLSGEDKNAWIADQVVRILKGTPIIITSKNYTETSRDYEVETGEPSEQYLVWRLKMEDGKEYNEGIKP